MNLTDTHCHLNLKDHFPNPAEAIREAKAYGVTRFVVVGIDLESSGYAVDLANEYEEVYATAGLHPTETYGFEDGWLEDFRPLLNHPKCVAVGEIGLDFYWDRAPKEDQFRALEAQVRLAEEFKKPIVYHCREAYAEMLTWLQRRPIALPQVFHCFAGTLAQAKLSLEMGLFFGVDGPVTYKKADELREVVKIVPAGRLVLETDSPFLSPMPHRGKPNTPGNARLVAEKVAEVRGISLEQVADETNLAVQQLLGI